MIELHLFLLEIGNNLVADVDSKQIAEELTRHDFSVCALNLIGHGASIGGILEQSSHCGFALRHTFKVFLCAAFLLFQFSSVCLYVCANLN